MKMQNCAGIVAILALAGSLSACGTMDRQQVGTATGAAVGGIAGHAVSDGSTLGTVGGAVAGGLIGNEVSK